MVVNGYLKRMNEEIYIVAAYTPDSEREELLRNLINQLHVANKNILLISHSVTPTDIVSKCNYHIYDKENKILFDDQYKFYAWNNVLPGAKIYSKDVGKTYTTLLPVYRLVLYGFSFAKIAGYKYAHYIEYDCSIKNFSFFDNNTTDLKNHSCIAYLNANEHPIGFYFAFNLDHYTFDDLKYDEPKFLNKLIEHYPKLYFVEELTKFFFMDNKKPLFKKDVDIDNTSLVGGLYCSRNSKTGTLTWAVPIVENDHLYLYICELDGKNVVIEYVVNDSYKQIELNPHHYWYHPICKWQNTKFLKIMINKMSHLEYDLTNQNVRKKLLENNTIERL